jgi:hypothetical protein
MGIRGIDIQVAIQRAAEAEKIQQGETSQARAGEAGLREDAETERARKQQQAPKTERSDQLIVRTRRDKERREAQDQSAARGDEEKEDETEQSKEGEIDQSKEEGTERSKEEGKVQSKGERLRKPIVEGQIDILA